jgi:PPE-repeat protein
MTAAFDFGAFPPEVNSAKIYTGPGSVSMLSAAAAWNGLASELRSQAANYSSIISNLTLEGWQGQASTAMAAAAAPYTAWMNTTAAQAEQTGDQARAAAAAYEAAYGMTVPPPVIAANRTQLASLVATNVLGQNAPAIAATEAHYGQMWAQDAATMYGYAAQSSAAAKVPSFTTAPQTTAPGGLAGQAAATSQSASTSTQATLSQLTSAIPNTLQSMTSPATSASSTSVLSELQGLLGGGSSGNSQLDSFWSAWGPNANIWNTLTSTGAINPLQAAQIVTSAGFLGPGASGAMAGSQGMSGLSPLGMAAGLGSGTSGMSGAAGLGAAGLGAAGSSMSAAVGQAGSIGSLSVPPNWTAAVPSAATPTAPGLGSTPLAAPPEVAAGVPGVAPSGAAVGARAGATGGIMDNRFLVRPPMVPSWAAVG